MRRRLLLLAGLIAGVTIAGTVGYYIIGGAEYSWIDALYMTVITIATIGYTEVIPLDGNPAGRIFTMLISVAGIGLLAYFLTSLVAFAVEGELTQTFRRKRMEKIAGSLKGHFILCGEGGVARHIANELKSTGRNYVVVARQACPGADNADAIHIEGDPTDSEVLKKAGVEKAAGLFAAADDDNLNLVISLTAKSVNPAIKVIAECSDIKNTEKIKRAGADGVVSPNFIGGMRMASLMVRPTVVSFLDVMLRDTAHNLRVEEVPLPVSAAGKSRSSLDLERFPAVLLLAIKTGGGWVYNPPGDYVCQAGDTLVVMASPEARQALEAGL